MFGNVNIPNCAGGKNLLTRFVLKELLNRKTQLVNSDMHFTGPIYRHPFEANTPLLQITSGCSHNQCTFCTMYADVKFAINEMEHIREDLNEIRKSHSQVKRIFLVNGDPFVLPISLLEEVLLLINEILPEIDTISTYSSVRNLEKKSVEDLQRLKRLGLDDLYVGLESGNNDALEIMNKGYSSEEALTNLNKLQKAKISYLALILLGIAGKGKGLQNANDTATILNQTKPRLVSVIPLGIFPGSRLEQLYVQGDFIPPTEREMLEEEKELLRLLELDKSQFYGGHMNNLVRVTGQLPQDKQFMIDQIDSALTSNSTEVLDTFLSRTIL